MNIKAKAQPFISAGGKANKGFYKPLFTAKFAMSRAEISSYPTTNGGQNR
jgi:hypothetical protein